MACCGYGGKYNIRVGCGETININGTKIVAGSCKNPSTRIIWDGAHFTEVANKIVFDQISTGAFNDPPISLDMACYRKWSLEVNGCILKIGQISFWVL